MSFGGPPGGFGGQYPHQQWVPGSGYPQPPHYPANPYIPPTAPHQPHNPYIPPSAHHHHHGGGGSHMHNVVQWVHAAGGSIPYGAVQGGYDDGSTLYVGRAHHDGDLVPGKVHPSHNCCYIAFGGNETPKHSYEVLVNPTNAHLSWVHTHEGGIPPGAVPAGHTSSGETLYVGRHHHEGSLTVGKVHPSHNCLYIAYGGREIPYHQYEVLCVPPTIY